LLAVASLLLLGCARKRAAPELSPPRSDVPAPAGLIAELALAHPESTWRSLRELGAPASELLPASFPLLASTLFGLPALGAGSLDQDVPMRGALLLADGKPSGLLALHALDGRELVASLTTGGKPPFRAERDAASGITFLLLATQATASGATLAVLDSYLLAGANREIVIAAGPFVARTLSKHPAPQADASLLVEQKALHELLVPALRARWGEYRGTLERDAQVERKAHADRSADFADPSAVLLGADAVFESFFAMLDSATRVELALTATSAYCALRLSVTPDPTGASKELAESLTGSDAHALLELPDSTLFALGVNRDVHAAQNARDTAGDEWVRVLGDRLTASDAKLVRGTFADWELGRGSHTAYGLLAGPSLAGFVSGAVAEPAALERAGHGFLRLLTLPSVRAPLAQFIGTPSVVESKAGAPGLARATVRFAAGAKGSKASEPIEFVWRIDNARAFAAAGEHAEPALATLESAARGEHALGGMDGLAASVTRLGTQVTLFAYLDARALGATTTAPVLLAFGKQNGLPTVYLELSKGALAAGIQRLGEH
jgi:hypothetical protein